MKTTWFTRWFGPTTTNRSRPKPSFDHLEGRELPAAGIQEQYMVELINRMRADPQAELQQMLLQPDVQAAMTYFNVNRTVLETQFAALTPQAPLAYNDNLDFAATKHSEEMLKADKQSHQLPGEKTLGERIADATYGPFAGVAENAFTNAQSVSNAHAAFAIDWGIGPNGLQDPAGHRANLMSPEVSDVGIGLVNTVAGKKSGPLLVTQNFGRLQTPGDPFLLGVVYNDTNNNTFYDIGEGLKGVTVTLTPQGGGAAVTLTTSDAGYYQSQVPAGTYDVKGAGGGLVADITKTVTVAAVNLKADLVTVTAQPPAQISLQSPIIIKENATALAPAQIKVTRSGNLNTTVSVPFTVTAGTGAGGAATPADYTIVTASPLVFAANETEKIIEINVVDRPGVFTGNKSFDIELDPVPANASVLIAATTATIIDNDASPTYTVSLVNAANGDIAENVAGGNLQVKVVYTGVGTGTVKLETVDGTAFGNPANAAAADLKDYTIVSQTLTFTGAGEQIINVPIRNNTTLDGDRSFSVKLSAPTLGTFKSPSLLFAVIKDDDIPPVGAATASISGPTEVLKTVAGTLISVTRTATTGTASVRIRSTGGTAVPGTDYTAIDQVVNFAAGVGTVMVTLSPTGNSAGDKTVILTLSDFTGVAQGTPNTLTVTIKDQVANPPAGNAPTGAADFFVVKKGDALSTAPSILANDTNAISAKIVKQPAGGTVTLATNGTFTFAPNAQFSGINRFTYRPSNGVDGSEITVTIMTHEALQVRKLYRQVLNREPDQGGWEGWTAQIQAGKASLGTVASGIFESQERLDPIITKYYQDYLSRTPDAAGLAGWRAQWQKDGGPENVIAGFIASPEYYAKAGGTDTGWVNALYQSLLGRAAAPAEVNAWLQVLQAPGGTRQKVVFGFINSEENRNLLVNGWFQQYLGRAPSTAERNQYVGQLNAGGSQRSVQIALIDLPEYLNSPPPPVAGTSNRVT